MEWKQEALYGEPTSSQMCGFLGMLDTDFWVVIAQEA